MLPACAKEYLTAAKYYCEVEVKVRDQITAVDAIFPPVFCSDIISKQYRFANVKPNIVDRIYYICSNCVVRRLQACYMYLSIRLHHAFLFKYSDNKNLRTCKYP